MGRRWAWMGMVGVCALLTGCREQENREPAAPVSARSPAPVRPGTSAPQAQANAAPTTGTEAQTASTEAPRPTPPVQRAAPAQTGANARASAPASSTAPQQQATPGSQGAPTVVTESGATQEAPEGRVMIGLEAIQASEDEAWHEGAARAARAAGKGESVPLDQVVIATGTVDGRITRVDKGTVQLRDGEGNMYQLRIDKRSRGVRQGQRVPVQQLEEGTPVRASFDLVGGSSIARDIEIRR